MDKCEKCINGGGCLEGCEFWFFDNLKKDGFSGLKITEKGIEKF